MTADNTTPNAEQSSPAGSVGSTDLIDAAELCDTLAVELLANAPTAKDGHDAIISAAEERLILWRAATILRRQASIAPRERRAEEKL